MALTFSDELVQHVVEQCPVAETGARMLIRFIEKNILPKIGSALLNQVDKSAKNKTIAMQCILSEEKEIDVVMQVEEKLNI